MDKKILMNTVKTSEVNAEEVGKVKGMVDQYKGKLFAIINIPLKYIMFDERYQTDERTERDLSYLTSKWKDEKCLPIMVVPHYEVGRFACFDGYGRTTALKIRNPENWEKVEIPAMVILQKFSNRTERLKYEANQYAFQDKGKAKMTPLHRHGAMLCIEDDAAKLMDQMKKKYQFDYKLTQGSRAESVLGSYSETYIIAKKYGEDCLDFIFNISHESGMHKKINGYSSYMMRALRDVWKFYVNEQSEEQREIITKKLVSYLIEVEPRHVRSRATSRYELLAEKTAVSMYIEDIICDRCYVEHKRKAVGKGIVAIKNIPKNSTNYVPVLS